MGAFPVDVGIFIYAYLHIIIAAVALVLAVIWKRNEFFAGLFFLFLWTVVNCWYMTLSVVMGISVIEFSQFGFIFLALVSFIIGMRPKETVPLSPE